MVETRPLTLFGNELGQFFIELPRYSTSAQETPHCTTVVKLLNFRWEAHQVSDLPVIRVDDNHFQVEREDGSQPEIYILPAGPGFLLDTSDYTFHIPPGLTNKPPNLIQLVRGGGHTYEHPWQQGKDVYVITGDTLQPQHGALPFRMFVSGEMLTLAIGRYVSAEESSIFVDFHTYWVGLITVI